MQWTLICQIQFFPSLLLRLDLFWLCFYYQANVIKLGVKRSSHQTTFSQATSSSEEGGGRWVRDNISSWFSDFLINIKWIIVCCVRLISHFPIRFCWKLFFSIGYMVKDTAKVGDACKSFFCWPFLNWNFIFFYLPSDNRFVQFHQWKAFVRLPIWPCLFSFEQDSKIIHTYKIC